MKFVQRLIAQVIHSIIERGRKREEARQRWIEIEQRRFEFYKDMPIEEVLERRASHDRRLPRISILQKDPLGHLSIKPVNKQAFCAGYVAEDIDHDKF